MSRALRIAALALLIAPDLSTAAADRVTSQADACKVLTSAAEHFVRPPKRPDEYVCQPYVSPAGYFVFSPRLRHPEPADAGAEWIGSNLVGWYAVRGNDGSVLEWDIGNEVPGPVRYLVLKRLK